MKNVLPKFQAMMAAILFGASAPLSKMLLGNIEPVLLAALLYLGCGFGLLLCQVIKNKTKPTKEAKLEFNDLPWLSGAILAGGVAAPIILMVSLKSTPAGEYRA